MSRFYAIAERPLIVDEVGERRGVPLGTVGCVDLSAVGAHDRVFVTSETEFIEGDVLERIGDGTPLDEYSATARERIALAGLVDTAWQPGWKLVDWLWAALTMDADPTGTTRAKPIMPTHKRVLELHLKDRIAPSLVRAQQLPRDPTQHPAWAPMQQVLQDDYLAIRARGGPHLQWLGAQRLKWRLSREAARDLIGDPNDDLPRDPTTSIADAFTNTNGTNLRDHSAGGFSWSEVTEADNMEINASNQVAREGGSLYTFCRAETDLASDDHFTEIDVVSTVTGVWFGACTRFAAAAETNYLAHFGFGTDEFFLFKVDAGSRTQLDTGVTGFNTPATVRCEANGSTIRCLVDGNEVSSVTNTDITGNTRPGINCRGSIVGAIGDNFAAQDLVADDIAILRRRMEAA